jgi:hypothetical protein
VICESDGTILQTMCVRQRLKSSSVSTSKDRAETTRKRDLDDESTCVPGRPIDQ